jgi:hypothetical protein
VLPAGGAFCAGGVPDLPFGPGAFEAVAANFVVNHVSDPRAHYERLVAPMIHNGQVVLPTKALLAVGVRAFQPASGDLAGRRRRPSPSSSHACRR